MKAKSLLLFLAVAQFCSAASHYIRAGAPGPTHDGSSWNNAWLTFAAANAAGFIRGDTYYIAGGTYTEGVYVNVNLSGSQWIYFKKANAADNSANPGWSNSFATTVATLEVSNAGGVFDLDKGYVSIDGVTGSGTSGHGIVLIQDNTASSYVVQLEVGKGPFSISHCEIKGSGFSVSLFATVGIYYNGGVKNLYVGYNWIHEVTTNGVIFNGMVGTNYTSDYGFLFENNWVSETGGCLDPTNHGQGMQLGGGSDLKYTITRNNVFRNVVGSAMVAFLAGADNISHDQNQIYNNIFGFTNTTLYNGLSPGPIWHEAIKTNVNVTNSNMLIYNNVFYNITTGGNLGQIVIEIITSNVQLKNNVRENCQFTSGDLVGTVLNNGYFGNNGAGIPSGTPGQVNGLATTFLDAASFNFSLVTGGYAVGAGVDLSATFTTDANGLTRTVPWDLGAYKYQASVSPGQPGTTSVLVGPF